MKNLKDLWNYFWSPRSVYFLPENFNFDPYSDEELLEMLSTGKYSLNSGHAIVEEILRRIIQFKKTMEKK